MRRLGFEPRTVCLEGSRAVHYASDAWSRLESDRAGSNRRWHHGKVPCYRYTTVTREPPPGADPGRSQYESEAAAVRGGSSCKAELPGLDSNQRKAGVRALLGSPTPHPEPRAEQCATRDLNPELAA